MAHKNVKLERNKKNGIQLRTKPSERLFNASWEFSSNKKHETFPSDASDGRSSSSLSPIPSSTFEPFINHFIHHDIQRILPQADANAAAAILVGLLAADFVDSEVIQALAEKVAERHEDLDAAQLTTVLLSFSRRSCGCPSSLLAAVASRSVGILDGLDVGGVLVFLNAFSKLETNCGEEEASRFSSAVGRALGLRLDGLRARLTLPAAAKMLRALGKLKGEDKRLDCVEILMEFLESQAANSFRVREVFLILLGAASLKNLRQTFVEFVVAKVVFFARCFPPQAVAAAAAALAKLQGKIPTASTVIGSLGEAIAVGAADLSGEDLIKLTSALPLLGVEAAEIAALLHGRAKQLEGEIAKDKMLIIATGLRRLGLAEPPSD
eukprot:GHVT01099262.1.p1 GENE.GHVT01099262.1~~GHVT01099262.1.p1  ORF type:complete len:412 (+),score=108.79 GHVT01099262.1:96-1238(+)